MQYFTNACKKVPIHWKQFPFPLCVIESPDKVEMIGIATEVGLTRNWCAVWSLRVHGVAVPGLFVVIDGVFESVEKESVVTELSRGRSTYHSATSPGQVTCAAEAQGTAPVRN